MEPKSPAYEDATKTAQMVMFVIPEKTIITVNGIAVELTAPAMARTNPVNVPLMFQGVKVE